MKTGCTRFQVECLIDLHRKRQGESMPRRIDIVPIGTDGPCGRTLYGAFDIDADYVLLNEHHHLDILLKMVRGQYPGAKIHCTQEVRKGIGS